jgi:hypothetical protein
MRRTLLVAALALTALAPATARAQSWTRWTAFTRTAGLDTARGYMTFGSQTVNVLWTGKAYDALLNNANGNYWQIPNAPYNQPGVSAPDVADMIQFSVATTASLTFSSPVDNLLMAVLSVGNPFTAVSYAFDRPFTLLTPTNTCVGGWCGWATGSGTSTLTAAEGHGLLLFSGSNANLTWSVDPQETWHGFTVGAMDVTNTVPEPATWALFGTGLAAVGLLRRRR